MHTTVLYWGISTEYIYKTGSGMKESIHIQNLSMYMWGMFFNCGATIFTSEGRYNLSLQGFNIFTWVLLCNYAFKGLVISQVNFIIPGGGRGEPGV